MCDKRTSHLNTTVGYLLPHLQGIATENAEDGDATENAEDGDVAEHAEMPANVVFINIQSHFWLKRR